VVHIFYYAALVLIWPCLVIAYRCCVLDCPSLDAPHGSLIVSNSYTKPSEPPQIPHRTGPLHLVTVWAVRLAASYCAHLAQWDHHRFDGLRENFGNLAILAKPGTNGVGGHDGSASRLRHGQKAASTATLAVVAIWLVAGIEAVADP